MRFFKKKSLIQIITTVPNIETAQKLSQSLLERKEAACIQQVGPVTSQFRWQGKIETTEEYILLIKTTQDNYPRIETTILNQHPYDCPEIIATPITTGLQSYLNWIQEEAN
tara:strand:+ start:244 stop:576 length:333 start_codon:yes stop_codon:yes gene_type:complete